MHRLVLCRDYILASHIQYFVCLVPQLLADDCRYCFAGFVFIHNPFFLGQKLLLFGEQVCNSHLVSCIVALVFRVAYDVAHR